MRAVFITLGLFSIPAFAQQEGLPHPELAITTLLASLLLVLVCIFVFAYLMKKTNLLKNVKGASQIKIVATQPLNTKGRVQIIELNGQQYLLAVTEQNITLLDKFAKPVNAENESDKEEKATPFATLLSKISKKSDA